MVRQSRTDDVMDGILADPPAERRQGRWPMGLVGMLGCIILVELAVSRLDDRLQTPSSAVFRFTSRALGADAARADVLVVGDSLLKFGVVPRILEERLGSRAFNLAHIGGQPPDTFFALRHALERGAKPSAIVVDFKANLLQVDPYRLHAEKAELYSLADCLHLGWSCKDIENPSTIAFAKLLPSFRFRSPIRGEIVAALKEQPWPGRGDVLATRRNWDANLGANVAARVPGAADIPEHWDEKAYLNPTFASHPDNTRYINRTLKLAARQGIPVYWVIPPILPRVQSRREELGVDAAYADFVRSFQARYRNLTVVDGRHAGYDAPVFVDAAHLDRVGASAFSLAVADVLRQGPGGPRWVALPAYREPEGVPPLEDVNQSRVALESAGQADRIVR